MCTEDSNNQLKFCTGGNWKVGETTQFKIILNLCSSVSYNLSMGSNKICNPFLILFLTSFLSFFPSPIWGACQSVSVLVCACADTQAPMLRGPFVCFLAVSLIIFKTFIIFKQEIVDFHFTLDSTNYRIGLAYQFESMSSYSEIISFFFPSLPMTL